MADLTKTVAPKTDQLNADDFIGTGDRTIKITGVREMQSKDQPIAIHFEGDNGKPWKPCLGMRRVLIELWGEEASENADKHYKGRRVTLYRDPDVKFGSATMGGIRISHASNIQSEQKILLTVGRARRIEYIVKPLKDDPEKFPISDADYLSWTDKMDQAQTVEDLAQVGKSIAEVSGRYDDQSAANLKAYYADRLRQIKEAAE